MRRNAGAEHPSRVRPALLGFSRLALLGMCAPAFAQVSTDRLLAQVTAAAEAFRENAPALLANEMLAQRCYRIPEHPRFAVGRAAETVYAQIVRHEVVSEYSVGSIKNDRSGKVFEIREVLQKDGVAMQTPAAARKALQMDISKGEDRIRRKMLAVFTDLGLLDVATDYGLILLSFTSAGLNDMELKSSGERYFGAEEAFVFEWRQTAGGLLDLRHANAERRPLSGQLWVRRRDGMPLRITASAEVVENKRRIVDEATVEFVSSTLNSVVPLLAVHRHFVDGQFLVENFYTYGRFRRFDAESRIEYLKGK